MLCTDWSHLCKNKYFYICINAYIMFVLYLGRERWAFTFILFPKSYFLTFRERERRENKRERNINKEEKHRLAAWLPCAGTPTGHWTHNAGMCPDQEWKQPPFSLRDCAQATEPHWPGHGPFLFTPYTHVDVRYFTETHTHTRTHKVKIIRLSYFRAWPWSRQAMPCLEQRSRT